MKKFSETKSQGFTIIETMIAMTIFLIVIMVGTTAILNAYTVGNKSKGMRSIMDNLSFVMEEMSRNIKTGYDYKCVPNGNSLPLDDNPESGDDCGALIFKNSEGDVWTYYIESDNKLYKTTPDFTGDPLLPDGVTITQGGFSVLGAEPPPGDSQQPFVIIKLAGTITYRKTTTPFSLQTAVSQRTNDLGI